MELANLTGNQLHHFAMNSQTDVFYHQCARRGLKYANALLRNQFDAEEAVQEAFCRMQQSQIVESDSQYKGKFFRTLRNHCIDRMRKRAVRKETDSSSVAELGSNSASVEYNELVSVLETAIGELPQQWSQALLLRTHAQLSYEEIAQAMQSSIDQVRTWIYRARRQLEERLTAAGHLN